MADQKPPVYVLTSLACVTCGDKVIVSMGARTMKCRCGVFPAFLLELKQEVLQNG